MTQKSDVLVIGGGPSGLRCAARLASRGLDVRVLEKKSATGQNVICTGIVGMEVFEDFGLDRGSIIREIRSVRLVSPRSTVVTYQHPRSFAYVVDRELFDRELANAAISAGATLELETRVDDLQAGPGGVAATVRRAGAEAERYEAAVAVVATGVDYGLHKRTGLAFPVDFLKGAQAELAVPDDTVTSIYFGRDVAPGAFAWSVPAAAGTARVGLLTRQDPKTGLRRFIEERCGAGGEAAIRTKVVAQGLLDTTVADRVLSVGEAAGQIKTTTGGGISYGLLCADIAADVLAGCFDRGAFDAAALSSYEALWRKAIQKEIVVGYYTRKMCARLSDARIEGLFHLAQTDGIIPIIRETADFDWHSGLIMALLQRLSFMRFFRGMKDHLGTGSLS